MRDIVEDIARVWKPLRIPTFVEMTNNQTPGASAEAALASEYQQDEWWLCHLFLGKRFDELDWSESNLYSIDHWPHYMESYARWYYLGGYLLFASTTTDQIDPYLTRDRIEFCVDIVRCSDYDGEKCTRAQLSVALRFLKDALLWIESHKFACHPSLAVDTRESVANLEEFLSGA